jgi:RNA polymerase sigma-70 factor (ECF subfamily)
MGRREEITGLLANIRQGNKEAVNQLLPLVYDELRLLARAQFRRERGAHTLHPTALVHEAFLRLANQRAPIESRSHFLALAATQMRRILLDYARKYRRRAGSGERVSIDDAVAIQQPRPVDVITLDVALTKLAALDPTLAQLVELRFFGGLSLEETAEAMGVSTATVKRSWNSARAFLRREMESGTHDTRAMGSDPANL